MSEHKDEKKTDTAPAPQGKVTKELLESLGHKVLPPREKSGNVDRSGPGDFSGGGFVSAHPFPRNSRQARPKSPTVIQNIPKFRRDSAETKFDFGLRGRLGSA
jgi:hypothetical protein